MTVPDDEGGRMVAAGLAERLEPAAVSPAAPGDAGIEPAVVAPAAPVASVVEPAASVPAAKTRPARRKGK